MALHQQSPKLSVWNVLTLFFTLLLHLTIFESAALASPFSVIGTDSSQFSKRYTGDIAPATGDKGPDTSNYPTDDEIKADYITANGPTVFYSGIGPPDPASSFAQSVGGRVLSQAFPTGYIGYKGRGKKWYRNFIDRASGIFADKASGEVFFVGKYNNELDLCRVWARVEYPSLLENPQVTKITLVDYSNFENKKTYPGLPKQTIKLKRSDDYCFDWEGDTEDPLGPDPQVGIGYYPGNCGVHVVQYQKTEENTNPGTTYRLDITLKDDQQETVGQKLFADAPTNQAVTVDSALPLVFKATAQKVDDDPLEFSYGSQSWDSNASQCKVGGYDSGTRQLDCGFTC